MSVRSPLLVLSALVLLGAELRAQDPASARDAWFRGRYDAEPRWRASGPPPVDPAQPLAPRALRLAPGDQEALLCGHVESPPEYAPVAGVLFRYGAGYNSVVTDCVAALTGDPRYDERALVLVSTSSQRASAEASFLAAGADLAKVDFFLAPANSVWARDYGPHFIWQDGAMGVVDSHYYPERPLDNFVPTLVAEGFLEVPAHAMGLYYSGGNFQPGPGRAGFTTTLVNQDNSEMSAGWIEHLYRDFQGIDTLHVFPRLPGSVDGTGHIDMWLYLVDEDTVVISEFLPGSNATAIQVTENAVPYMQGLGFEVLRTPAWNVGWTHYTYTNAFRVNDRIFVPVYGPGNPSYLDEDQQALAAWQAAAGPNVELVPIDCYDIIPAAGAIHCIVKQIPRYTAPQPSVALLAPAGGELLVSGTTQELRWEATDDVAVEHLQIALSTDGGQSFPLVLAPRERDTGLFEWTVPALDTPRAFVRLLAADADGNLAGVLSHGRIDIRAAAQRVYDFSSGAGVDKWGWGHQTQSWAEVDGLRYPVSAEIETLVPGAYAALASSDATGGDDDTNRYRAPDPPSGRESTHVFEFVLAEDPATILDIQARWEGYGDKCLQMELYVWDGAAGNWGDGRGRTGENLYMANFAGNQDAALVGAIRDGFERYVDAQGRLTLLLYAERPSERSFHDHLSVTVTRE